MDTLPKAAEQKLKQEPTAEISNDSQNNTSYRLGMVAWGDSKSLSAYSICFLVVNSCLNPTPRTRFAQGARLFLGLPSKTERTHTVSEKVYQKSHI